EPAMRLEGRPEDALEVVDSDAGDEDAGVGLHALDRRLADRLPVAQSSHAGLLVRAQREVFDGREGRRLAAATARSTSAWLARVIASTSPGVQTPVRTSRVVARSIGQRAIHESTS